MDADPTMYDNFDNPAYDGSFRNDLWHFAADESGGSATQGEGVLKLSVNPGKHLEMLLRQYRPALLETPMFFEARFRLGSARGSYHSYLGVWEQRSSFAASCSAVGDPEQPYVDCHWKGPFGDSAASERMNVALDTWYTLRIEIDSVTMEAPCSVDGQQVLVGIPTGADQLQTPDFILTIEISANSESSEAAVVYLDDVRLGPIE